MFTSGPPSRVELWLGERLVGPARLGGARPDIRDAYRRDDATACGFEHVVEVGDPNDGDRRATLRALAHGRDGERLWLEPRTASILPREALAPVAPLPAPVDRPGAPRGGGAASPRLVAFTHQLDLGGAQLYLLDLLKGLRDEGFACTVASPLDGPVRDDLEALGVDVHVSEPLPIGSPRAYAGRVAELAAWAERGGFDVALVNTALAFAGADAAAAIRLPVVWSIHESYSPSTLWWMYGDALHPEVRTRAERALAGAQAVLFEAEATAALYGAQVRPERTAVLPYGLDLAPLDAARARFDQAESRRARSIPEDARVVLCVGTVEPRKAQVPLAQAFDLVADRHPDARLVLVGARGDLHSQALEQWVSVAAARERMHVLPVLEDVWSWYGLADVLVCASDVESTPRSVLEAMAWETPVLATSVFGLPELIEDGVTGWLCPPRDVRAMADALDRVLGAEPSELRRIGAAGGALVRRRHRLDEYAAACARLLRGAARSADSADRRVAGA